MPPDGLRYDVPRRNATQDVRAPHALARTGLPNANTNPLALSLIIPYLYLGMGPTPQTQRNSPHKSIGPSRNQPLNLLPKHMPPPPPLNQDPEAYRPAARLFALSVPIACNHTLRPNLGLAHPIKSRHPCLPGLHPHLSPYFSLLYSPGSLLSPTFPYRSWELSDSNSPMQLWVSWT